MGEREIEAFLSSLAIQGKVSASTQNQAFNALLFLYRHVLRKELEAAIQAVRAKRPQRLPTVLSREEVRRVIAAKAPCQFPPLSWLTTHSTAPIRSTAAIRFPGATSWNPQRVNAGMSATTRLV